VTTKDQVIALVRSVFARNKYPGDAFLVGSHEGCEPEEEVGPFRGKTDWVALDAKFLDAHAGALHFFSEAGLRFFLPAYLIADVRGELKYAETEFCLAHGFSEVATEVTHNGRQFVLRAGKSQFINPRRFGAATFSDYARYRLSVFTREEAGAIVAYLEYKRDSVKGDATTKYIDAALDLFWRKRAKIAPGAAALELYVKDQEDYLDAVRREQEKSG